MGRIKCFLKPGDKVLIRGEEEPCIYLGNEDFSSARWNGAVYFDYKRVSGEIVKHSLSGNLIEILGIDDGYDRHLIFSDNCYWKFT